MNKNTDINAGLRERILDRCGSIRQFAIAAGIERTQVYPILRGEALPGLVNFCNMARTLGLNLDEFYALLVDGEAERKEATG